jgi:predicted O-methyltransferase YrrM
MSRLLLAGILISCCFAGKRYVAPNRKEKMGVDLTLSDLYHPWKDDAQPPAPKSDQHRISEYMLNTVKNGDSIDHAINLFESFSNSNRMGMTLGDQKGKVIEERFAKLLETENVSDDIVIVEFGSHIGDGTLRIIRQLAKSKRQVTIVSLEANPEWLAIGTSLVRHVLSISGILNVKYTPVLLTSDVAALADNLIKYHGVTRVDGLFLDHVHGKFYTDLNVLWDHGLLHTGTVIVADNAMRHRQVMEKFIQFVDQHSTDFELVYVVDPYPDEVLCAVWKETRAERDEL